MVNWILRSIVYRILWRLAFKAISRVIVIALLTAPFAWREAVVQYHHFVAKLDNVVHVRQ